MIRKISGWIGGEQASRAVLGVCAERDVAVPVRRRTVQRTLPTACVAMHNVVVLNKVGPERHTRRCPVGILDR